MPKLTQDSTMSLLQKLLASLKTLKGFVFLSTVAIALLVFLGATLASSLLYEKLLGERTQETSREISAQNRAGGIADFAI